MSAFNQLILIFQYFLVLFAAGTLALTWHDKNFSTPLYMHQLSEGTLRFSANAVIALTDVYTGSDDFRDAADAKQKMKSWVDNHPDFYPHVAQHDFEAWLLPFWSDIQKLAGHNKKMPGKASRFSVCPCFYIDSIPATTKQ